MRTLGDLLAIKVTEKASKTHCHPGDVFYYYEVPDSTSLLELLTAPGQYGQILASAIRRRMAAAGVTESDLTE